MCEKYKSRKKLKCWSFDHGHLSWHLLKSSNVHQVEVCVTRFHSTTAKKAAMATHEHCFNLNEQYESMRAPAICY